MGKIARNLFPRLNFWTLTGLLFVFFTLLYAVLLQHNIRFDLTRDKIFTLSPKTLQILRELGGDAITVKAFFKDGQPGREELEDLLKTYAHYSPHFHYQFVDPDRNPGQARAYGVDEYGTMIVERRGKRERFREITEESLTNAFLKLVESRVKTIVFTTGHGEKALSDKQEQGYSNFRARLEAENYQAKEVLLSRDSIPDETDVIVVAGPQTDFLPEEIGVLKTYLEKGGKVLLLLDPVEANLSRFEEWLQAYGVILGRDIVVDKLSKLFGADYLIPVVMQYGKHKITDKFNLACFLPLARSVTVKKEQPEGFKLTELAFTSQGSWAERDQKEIESGKVSLGAGDLAGPVSIGVALEKENSNMRLVIFGDSNFADNAHFYLSGNKDLVLNATAWLSGEEKLVNIRPKERATSPLVLSADQQKLIFIVPVFVLPLISVGSGLAVLLYRKKYL